MIHTGEQRKAVYRELRSTGMAAWKAWERSETCCVRWYGDRPVIDETAEVLKEMLTENTGRALLDSGDYYGRNWERNQTRDFDSEPETLLQFDTWRDSEGNERADICIMHNVYHWLRDRLIFNAELTELFDRMVDEDDSSPSWLADAEAFPGWLVERGKVESVSGIYGDGEPVIVNTYNHESLLSQVIQFVYWEDENGEHVALQIHGGCDVRGGYTRPRIFDVDGNLGELAIFDDQRAVVYAQNNADTRQPTLDGGHVPENDHGWETDDGYHLYPGDVGRSADSPRPDCDLREYPISHDPSDRGNGFLYIDDDGNGYSPLTGVKLIACPF